VVAVSFFGKAEVLQRHPRAKQRRAKCIFHATLLADWPLPKRRVGRFTLSIAAQGTGKRAHLRDVTVRVPPQRIFHR
jgi:hypothetical protein